MPTFGQQVIRFYERLRFEDRLPSGIAVMQPFQSPPAARAVKAFYEKYFDDQAPRIFLIGINPGRFGGGATGIPFTDPLKLEIDCGISHSFEKKKERSADFVYEVIREYGGPELFYRHFYLTAVCPLGFTKKGVNMNYYDDKQLMALLEPFVVNTLHAQLAFGADRRQAICLGRGKNHQYLRRLNEQHHFFDRILALEHPRYIMQYKWKEKERYVLQFVQTLRSLL